MNGAIWAQAMTSTLLALRIWGRQQKQQG